MLNVEVTFGYALKTNGEEGWLELGIACEELALFGEAREIGDHNCLGGQLVYLRVQVEERPVDKRLEARILVDSEQT